MKLKRSLVFWAAAAQIALTSCSTIYFHNGPHTETTGTEYSEWHHDGIMGLVEFSPPVDLANHCEGKSWASVKVQENFIQGLVNKITYRLYDPWEVTYSCK